MKFSLIGWVKGKDGFGQPVTVNFKGNDSHQTTFGGLLTIIVKVMTILMTVTKVTELMEMNDPQLTESSNIMNAA